MNKKKILIVEDESLVAMDIQECLNSSYEVVGIASRGDCALTLVKDKQPDLVIMDIRLGGEMDGIETAWSIRLHYGVPVMFLTAFKDEVTYSRAGLSLPHAYLVKPFQDKELLAKLESCFSVETKRRHQRRSPPWN